MLGRGMVTDPGLALAIRAASAGDTGTIAPVNWHTLIPLIVDFWQLVRARLERRQQAGRLKQWLNFLCCRYPQAEVAYQALKTANDPAVIEAWLATFPSKS